ncbi:unnamed protein product [Boreogadus saida]
MQQGGERPGSRLRQRPGCDVDRQCCYIRQHHVPYVRGIRETPRQHNSDGQGANLRPRQWGRNRRLTVLRQGAPPPQSLRGSAHRRVEGVAALSSALLPKAP